MEFDKLFKQLSDIESVDFKDLQVSTVLNIDANVKSEGATIYSITGCNNRSIMNRSIMEKFYSMERSKDNKLRPAFVVAEKFDMGEDANLYNAIISKLEAVYNASQQDGVLKTQDKNSNSYVLWGNGGVAVDHLSSASDVTNFFYDEEGRVKKVVTDTQTRTFEYNDDGSYKIVETFYQYDEHHNLTETAVSEYGFNESEEPQYAIDKSKNGSMNVKTYTIQDDSSGHKIITEDLKCKDMHNRINNRIINSIRMFKDFVRPVEYLPGNIADYYNFNSFGTCVKNRVLSVSPHQVMINQFCVEMQERNLVENSDETAVSIVNTAYNNLTFRQASMILEMNEINKEIIDAESDPVEVFNTSILNKKDQTSRLSIEIEIIKASSKSAGSINKAKIVYQHSYGITVTMNSLFDYDGNRTDHVIVDLSKYSNFNYSLKEILTAFKSELRNYSEYDFNLCDNKLAEVIYSLFISDDIIRITSIVISFNGNDHSDCRINFESIIFKNNYSITKWSFYNAKPEGIFNTLIEFADNSPTHFVNMTIDTEDFDCHIKMEVSSTGVDKYSFITTENTKGRIEQWEDQAKQLLTIQETKSISGQNTPVHIIPMKK